MPKPFKKIQLLIISVVALAALTSCGWHLRGALVLPENLNRVHIVDESRSVQFVEMVEKLLISNDVTVSESLSEAQLIIRLESLSEQDRNASISSSGRVAEKELSAEVTYRIEDNAGNLLLPAAEESVIRTYRYDENDIVATTNEERLVQDEMRRELAQKLLRRLRFIDFSQSLTTSTPN